MAKDLRISFLLDFYGDMLTDTQREVVDAYYNEDLSLPRLPKTGTSPARACGTPSSARSSSCWRWRNGWAWPGASRKSKKP